MSGNENDTAGSLAPDNRADSHTSGRGGRARGAGRGRGSGRGNRSGRGNGGRSSAPQTFFGNTDGMKGNVFQCHGESTNKQQFLKTIGVLDEHINKTVSYPQDIASICRTFKVVKLTQPTNLTKEEYAEDMGKRMI
jgi:hypothetical protein